MTLEIDEDSVRYPTPGQPANWRDQVQVIAVDPSPNPRWFTAKFNHDHKPGFSIAVDPTGRRHSHYAPWLDPNARIYRALEFLECGPRAAGVTAGGRWPGKINLNTVWDIEIFDALCDYRPEGNQFGIDKDNAKPTFANLLASRTPGGVPRPGDRPLLSLATGTTLPSDNQYPGFRTAVNTTVNKPPPGKPQPAKVRVQQTSGTVAATGYTWSILPQSWLVIEPGTANEETVQVTAVNPATGQFTATFARGHIAPFAVASYAGGLGIGDTYLRGHPGGATKPWFSLYYSNLNHPYLDWELATKLYNNVTNRSNCFAVWLTVGFFEVNQEQTVPDANGVLARRIWLGQEIGRAENRHRRHRMFAVLDRTVLANHPGPPTGNQPFNAHANPALVPFFSIIE